MICPSVPSCFASFSITLRLHPLCFLYQRGCFFFCSVKMFQLFHRYLGIATGENSVTSCFSCSITHACPLWCDLSFISAGKMEPGDRLKGTVIVRFVGNQWATRVIFPQPLHFAKHMRAYNSSTYTVADTSICLFLVSGHFYIVVLLLLLE